MVTLIVTMGVGSLDLYSRRLAQHLPPSIPKVYTTIYQDLAKHFNTPLLSRAALEALRRDTAFVKELNRLGEVFHLPNHHLGRYGAFLAKPYIITVHDLVRYLDAKGYGRSFSDEGFLIHRPNLRDRLYLGLDAMGIRRAAKVIAVSYATRRDVTRYLKVPEERVTVVYEGVDHEVYKPVKRRPVEHPYVLYVGTEHPRKNFISLLKAFRKLKRDRCFEALKLVKIGRAGGLEADFRGRTLRAIKALKLENDVTFVGYIAEEELVRYYSNAECFVYPSFYEGFGLPVVEAMACGCPVICSNSSSLPEVAGSAAVQVDPRDVNGLATALKKVLTDDRLRKEMVEKGFERSRRFSWRRTAEETVKVYREVDERYR